ncbi:MAG: FAD-binding protein [Myxococcales bacterium]|nr:FAD-binding protein [Myxococcales bacterium]HQY62709.1 D-arabinono-1,4-lactone oxidase [Polyangiaceae bacterium]
MPAPSGLPPRPPRTADDRFLNWAGTVSTRPSSWREPTSEDEVAGLVAEARERGGRVRVVGAGHSWSEVAAPNDVAVSLDRLAGLVSLDPERGLATVRAGTRLRDLNAALAARGYALPIVGSIAAQSLAGATATGTHGSSLVHGNLASLVRAMKLVDGRGELTTLAEPDPRLLGARVSLGALGVVTELTVRVEPAFQLLCTVERVPVSAAVRGLEAIARSAEYVKVWWLPHARHAYVYRYERTRLPSSPWPARVRWVEDHLVHAHVFPAVVALEGRAPRLVPAVNWLVGPTLTHGPRVAPSALALSTPMPFVHRETEAAVPLARASEAFERLVPLLLGRAHHVNMPVELRFVPADDAWLSPAHGADTCQVGVYAGGVPGIDETFAAFWRVMRELPARPHWGKELARVGHDAEELAPLYPRLAELQALRAELDPDRVFESPFLQRVLPP